MKWNIVITPSISMFYRFMKLLLLLLITIISCAKSFTGKEKMDWNAILIHEEIKKWIINLSAWTRGVFLLDIDDCVNHTCKNGASCTDGINGYSCNCSVGFSGEHCETSMYSRREIDTASSRQLSTSIITFALSLLNFSVDLDDCVNHNCSNGASCIDGINSYSCNCSAGFTGLNCQTSKERVNINTMLLHKLNFQALVKLAVFINPVWLFPDIDDCVIHACANGASCVDGINTYSCNCAAGFSGTYCDIGK